MSKKGFINLSMTNFFSGLCSRPSGGVLFFWTGAEALEQAMRGGYPEGDSTAAQHCFSKAGFT